MNDKLIIKGTKSGLIFTTLAMPDATTLLNEVHARFEAAPSFFKGAQITLAVGEMMLESEQVGRMKLLCEQYGARLSRLISTAEVSRNAAQSNGLESTIPLAPEAIQPRADEEERLAEEDALLLRRTLRSGQSVQFAGNVTVIGDVNPGAEIIAGGDIVVWGVLRGTAHAGALGDENSIICALQMFPSLLRIGTRIGRPPEDYGTRRAPTPEIAWVEHEQILVDSSEVWVKRDRNRARASLARPS